MKFKKIFNSPALNLGVKFSGGNFFVMAIGAVSTVIYARWVDPETLGMFTKYSILPGYLSIGGFFIYSAYNRNFLHLLGKKDNEAAYRVASISKWWYASLSIAGSLIFLGLALIALFKGDMPGVIGWLAQVIVFGSMMYKKFLSVLYRSNAEFLTMNKNSIKSSIIGILMLPLIYFFGFFGLAGRRMIQEGYDLALFIKNAPVKIKSLFNGTELFRYIKFSLPIEIPAYMDSGMKTSTIALIIVMNLGERELGIYNIALALNGFILVFSRSFNQIIVTKLMLKYGETEDFLETLKYVLKPVFLLTFAALGGLIIVNLIITPLIGFVIPNYLESVIIFQILSFDVLFSIIRSPFELFISASMKFEIIAIRVSKIVLTLVMLFIFHDSLVQIALIIMSANLINVSAGYLLMFYKVRKLKSESQY